jgi:hypothetical protein
MIFTLDEIEQALVRYQEIEAEQEAKSLELQVEESKTSELNSRKRSVEDPYRSQDDQV